jgi:hypothetical protein
MQPNVLTPTVKLFRERQMFIVLQTNGARQIQVHQDVGIHQLHLKLRANTVKTLIATLRSAMRTNTCLIAFKPSVPNLKTKTITDALNLQLQKIACGMEYALILNAKIRQLTAIIHHV